MALAIDASTPAAVSGSGTLTTASFTPPTDSVLLVAFAGNSTSGENPPTPTVTDNLGSHLTYNLVAWKSHADSPTVNGQAAMWTAHVTTGAAMTVSVTNNSGSTHQAFRVWVLTGEDLVDWVGASGKTGSTSASSVHQSYTAEATSGWGFGVITDWDALGSETAGANNTMDGTGTVGGQFSYGFIRRTVDDDSIGASNTLDVTLPATSTNLSWVWVELLPVAANEILLDPPPFQVLPPPFIMPWTGPQAWHRSWFGAPDAPGGGPVTLSVRATEGGSTNNGIAISVKVLTGQSATQNGATATQATTSPPNLSITPNATGSRVYGCMTDAGGSTAWTANGSTTFDQNQSDTTNTAAYGAFKSTSTTTASTPVTLGATAPTVASGGIAQVEILGTTTEDSSSPPNVFAATATTAVTIPFAAPAGSLVVARVCSDGGAGVCTMSVTGGGLVWTELVKANGTGNGYAGVWIAQIPGGGSSTNAPAEVASGAGSALDAAAEVDANAETATGTGSALDATVSTASSTNAPAEVASGTGTAPDASVDVQVGSGAGTGTGSALDPSVSVTANAEAATGTGSGLDATVSTSSNVTAAAEAATGTGAAPDPTAAITANAEAATGTGSGQDPTAATGGNAQAATGTGSALDALTATGANAEAATGTSATVDPSVAVTVFAEVASGTGQALDATVSTAALTNAPAEVATGTGTAYDTSVTITVNAEAATAVGSAPDPTAAVTVTVGAATGTGSAPAPSPGPSATPPEAAGSGTAFDASVAIQVNAEAAIGSGSAPDPTPLVGGPGNALAEVAMGSGFAYDARTRKLILRPFTGTTTRPDSGRTGRPSTGVTLRP